MKEYLEDQLIFEVAEEDVLEVREGLEQGRIGGIRACPDRRDRINNFNCKK